MAKPDEPTTPVWDRFLRLAHWLLALSVTIALLSGFFGGLPRLWLHLVVGIVALITVALRLVWGFTGPGSARFSGFWPTPRAILAHLRGRDRRHLGHNPLGALMVFALLGCVLALALSGALSLGGVYKIGPFAAEGFALGQIAGSAHEILAFLILALIAAHLGGVVFESLRSKENLARAMVTGQKASRQGDHGLPKRRALWGLAMVLSLSVVIGGTAGLLSLAKRPVAGLPVASSATVASECGDCHMAYPASLLPAAAWQHVLANLDNHFGEDASLDPETTATISQWLSDNAAESADTLPAHAFRAPTPTALGQITATPGWTRLHQDIQADVFKRAPIYSAANCLACHKDAEGGRFSPLVIAIPAQPNPAQPSPAPN